jgi:O-antigen/teichoic acid export membrane protein
VSDAGPSATAAGNAPRSRSLLGNAIANSTLGLTTAVYSLSVPAALVRVFPPNKFAVWALVLQISGYAGILGLGLQDAIGRYVAFYSAQDNVRARDEFISTAFYVLCASAAVSMAGFAVVSANVGSLFPRIPSQLRASLSTMLLAVGGVASLALPFTVFSGVLVGLRRNDLVAMVASSTKLLLAAALILSAWIFQSLAWLTFWFAALNLASYLIIWRVCRSYVAPASATAPRFTRDAFLEIARYCGTAVIWQISMFVISGLDVAIVGRFDFPALAFYSVCVTPVAVLSGSGAALFGPLIQVGAAHAAHGRQRQLAQLLMRATRYATIIMSLAAVVVSFFAEQILGAWLGSEYASRSAPILRLLMIGHALRQLTYPYAALLIAMGQQSKLLLSPVAEAVVNVCVAILAGRRFGAIGVAYAVVIGSVVMLLLNFTFNLPRTHGREFSRRTLLVRSILLPMACFLPMALAGLTGPLHLGTQTTFYIKVALLLASIAALWKLAVESAEKAAALAAAGRAWKRARRLVS